MWNLLMLLSSSVLTCDFYSIKKKTKAFLLFTFYEFCIDNVHNDTNAKIGPAETSS